jgi:hypothetical protein
VAEVLRRGDTSKGSLLNNGIESNTNRSHRAGGRMKGKPCQDRIGQVRGIGHKLNLLVIKVGDFRTGTDRQDR